MPKMLIIDDHAAFRKQITNHFEKLGFTMIEAENGKEGIDVIMKNKDLDVIILDCQMPVMDGMAMLEEVSKDHDLEDLPPIIMLTAERGEKLREMGLGMGVTLWALKPIKMKNLELTINEILEDDDL